MSDSVEGHAIEPQSEPKSAKVKRKPLIFGAIAIVVVAGALLCSVVSKYLGSPLQEGQVLSYLPSV
jgi:hypothetical protein